MSFPDFLQPIFKPIGTTPTTPYQGAPSDLQAQLNVLLGIIKTRHSYPATFLVCSGTVLNGAADGTELTYFVVPNDKVYVLKNIDLIYAGTGSYRIKCKWEAMGSAVDVIENTATHTHWYGYMVMGPGSRLQITQGATVASTGTINGGFSGDIFDR